VSNYPMLFSKKGLPLGKGGTRPSRKRVIPNIVRKTGKKRAPEPHRKNSPPPVPKRRETFGGGMDLIILISRMALKNRVSWTPTLSGTPSFF